MKKATTNTTQTNKKTQHHKHHRKFTQKMLFSWVLLLVLCICLGVFVLASKSIDEDSAYTCISIIVILLLITALITFHKYHHKGRRNVVIMNSVLSGLFIVTALSSLFIVKDVSKLRSQADDMKQHLSSTVKYMKSEDVQSAKGSIDVLDNDLALLEKNLSNPSWDFIESLPLVGKQVTSIRGVVNAVSNASTSIINPMCDLLEEHPLSTLKVDGGYDVTTLNSYVDFMDSVNPTVVNINATIKDTDISLSGMQDEIEEYLSSLNAFATSYQNYSPAIKAVLGDGENREYLLIAQNEAENRSMGGTPGMMTILSIQDNVLHIGKFTTFNDYFTDTTQFSEAPTEQEVKLFTDRMSLKVYDANYSPDYTRAAKIWASAYESQNGKTINGVISLNTTVIQRVLSTFNETMTLSDGTKLTSDNVMKSMSRDLIYQYMPNGESEGNDILDGLYAEIGSDASDIIANNLSVQNLPKYKELFETFIKDESVWIWMSDEDEEEVMQKLNVSGELITDESKYTTGVYYAFNESCKMGWFLDLDTTLSDKIDNEDGTYSYEVSVTIKNTFTQADYEGSGSFILGSKNGSLSGMLHLFAPSGGKITNIKSDNGATFTEDTYEDLQVFYNTDLTVAPGSSMTVTYTVTLDKMVDEDLIIRKTPVLEEYR